SGGFYPALPRPPGRTAFAILGPPTDPHGALTMKLARIAACAALVAAGFHVHAQNLGFLRDSPIQRMTKEDTGMMVRNSSEALNRNADGETSGWSKPKTGASGTATPLGT